MKYCKHCGEQIDDECVVCPKCGKQVEEIKVNEKNIIINNSAAASSTAPGRHKKKYNLLIDIFMTICTCGLWLIWVFIRPKYEY